jgi:tRNA threonylcarbamoyladenosine biosynthesis protein TsaB
MLLAINTSTLQFGLALLDEDGTLRAEHIMSQAKGHFGGLMPAFEFLLHSSASHIQGVRCIAVAIGPGSFTGLRVGISLAKGLCHGLQVPIMGVSSLEAMASQIPYSDFLIVPVLSSRKGEVFTAKFSRRDKDRLVRQSEDECVRLEAFPVLKQKPMCVVGNDFAAQGPALKQRLGPNGIMAPRHCWNLRPSSIGALGLQRYHAKHFDAPHSLNPVYLRPPDIRPNPFPLISH